MATSSSDNSTTTTCDYKELLPDQPETQLQQFHDLFPILKARYLFLNSKLKAAGEEEAQQEEHLKSKRARKSSDSSTYVTSCCLRVLKEHLLRQCVTGYQLTKLLTSSPDPAKTSQFTVTTYRRLLERLEVMATQSLEQTELGNKLVEARKKLAEAQTSCYEVKQKLSTRLQEHDEERKELEKQVKRNKKAEGSLGSKLIKINFMRTLMVMLVSNSGKDLRKHSDLAQVLFDYSSPLSIRDLSREAPSK